VPADGGGAIVGRLVGRDDQVAIGTVLTGAALKGAGFASAVLPLGQITRTSGAERWCARS
jgi:hypothetical protein